MTWVIFLRIKQGSQQNKSQQRSHFKAYSQEFGPQCEKAMRMKENITFRNEKLWFTFFRWICGLKLLSF